MLAIATKTAIKCNPSQSPYWPLISNRISLNIDSDLGHLASVLAWFAPFRPMLGDDAAWQQCQIAMAEAFTNAVRHAHRGLPKETPIHLEAALEGDQLIMEICDRGQPFDLERYLHNLPPISQEAEGGRGLKLIKDIADQVSYQRQGEAGNCLRIVKQLTHHPLPISARG